MNIKLQFIRDQKGNVSSKRIMAFLALAYAMQYPYTGAVENRESVVQMFLMFAGAVVGAAASEFFASNKNKEL